MYYQINAKDERLRNLNKEEYDSFIFDAFTILALDQLVSGEEINVSDLITTLVDGGKSFDNYNVKVRTIRNIVANNTSSATYLVYQTVTDKKTRERRPFLLIPIVLRKKGTTIKRNGPIVLNPLLVEHFSTISMTFKLPLTIKDVRQLDTAEVNELLDKLDYRLSFELYLTHFKIQFNELKGAGKPLFQLVRSGAPRSITTTQLQTIENKAIIQHVLEMNNLYLRTSHLHQPEYLIVDMFVNLALQKKNVLYLSQYDSAQIKDVLSKSGLTSIVHNLVDPFETTPEPIDQGFVATNLQTIQTGLLQYQSQMRHQEEEIPYHSVLRQLIKLSRKPLHAMPLDAVDSIHKKDYDAISRLLDEIEALMKKLGIENPSTAHWNDLGLREVRNHEKEFQVQISSLLAVIYDIRSILLDLVSEHAFIVPSDVNELANDLDYTSYLTTSKYPSSWFEDGVFAGVESSLQEHADIMVRYNALVHTLTGNYKRESLEEQLPERYQAMKHPSFCPTDEHLDYLITSRQEILSKNQQLKRVWKDILNSLDEFEVVYRTQRGPGFIDYVRLNNKLLLDASFDRKWLEVDFQKMEFLQQQMNLRKPAIDAYIRDYQAIIPYASAKVLTLDSEILAKYKERLSKRFLLSADEKTSTRLVEQYVTEDYQSLNVKQKEAMVDRFLSLQQLVQPLEDVTNLIQTTVKINVDIHQLHEYQAVVAMIVNNASNYTLQTMDQYRLNKLKIVDAGFQQTLKELDQLLSIQAFEAADYHDPATTSELVRDLDQFFQQFYMSVDLFMKLQNQSGKRPTATTIQGLVGIIERVRATKAKIDELEPAMKQYYQSMYDVEKTDFTTIKQLRQEFSLLLGHFSDFESMKQEYAKDQFLFIKEQIRVLLSDLKAYDKQLTILTGYFSNQEFPTDVVAFISYLEPFNQLEDLQMWLDLSDNIQSLRGFKQSRIAAQINTGVYSTSLKRSFQNEYLKVLATSFNAPVDVAAIKEEYKNYKEASIQQIKQQRYDVIRKVRKPRITMSNLQTLPLLDRKTYDVIMVNGVERLPEVLIGHLRGLGHQQIYIEDQFQPMMLGMINKPRQGMYPPLNEVTFHQTQMRANLLSTKFDSPGVIHPVTVTKVHSIPLAQSVVAKLKETSGYVTVVLFRAEQRNVVLESIRALILDEDPMVADTLLAHLRVAVDPEYVVTSQTLYVVWDRYVEIDKISRYLPVASEIIIVNEDQTLDDESIERYVQSSISYYGEIEDEVLLWLVSQLPEEYTYKKAMKPYDIAVSKGEDVDLLIHLMVYDEDQVDILDQSLLLHDHAYDAVPKLFIALHELYPTELVASIKASIKGLL